jgi:F-type H+-transporting ATPase subunit b
MRLKIKTNILTAMVVLLVCADAFCSEGGENAGGQSIFSGSYGDAFWTVAAFILLLIVLSKLAWKPVLNGLTAREQHIQQQIESAELARQRAEKMLDDAKQQGVVVMQQAIEQADRYKQLLAEKTRQEIFALKRKSQDDIERAYAVASEHLWKQAADIALSVGSKVLERNITAQDNQRLIEQAIAGLRQ